MDPFTRLRLHRLTRAVYKGAEEAPGERPSRIARLLPSRSSAILLLVLLVVLAAAGILRARAPVSTGLADSHSASEDESQSAAVETTRSGTGEAVVAEDEEPSSAALLVVHVAGEVSAPGVVRLPIGSRVVDALEAAGGGSAEADLDALNLARPLVDGEQVLVPLRGAPSSAAGAGGAEARAGRGCVDLATADAFALEELDGVGPALAKRIIEFRESSGPFASVDDLDAVPGIGPALLARIRAGVCP